jgi:hypothetical protein
MMAHLAAAPTRREPIWHPVLQTSREEIAETCRDARYTRVLRGVRGRELSRQVDAATERQIAQIAEKAGELILNGADYWPALVLAAERVLRRPPSPSGAS